MKNRHIYFGILGAILLGIGDWLLGYVDPAPINGVAWNALLAGYKDYDVFRPVVAMPLGFFGVLSYAPCMWGMGQIFNDKKICRMQSILMIAGMGGWALLHYLYSAAIFVFAWMYQNIGLDEAIRTSNALYRAIMPGMSLWLIFMLVPFVFHFIDIVKGRSYLPKKILFFHTLVWWVLIYFGVSVLPQTAFLNGLRTFAMNGSMMIWLIAVLIYNNKNKYL